MLSSTPITRYPSDTHSATTVLSRHIPPYPQNASPFESLIQYILQSIKPCKMSRYQCACGSLCNHFLLVHLACACAFFPDACVCYKCPKRTMWLSLTLSPYTRAVCAGGKREESDLYIVWHSCPCIPLRHGCQTPTDGKSASAQHASTGHINTGNHTPSHTQPQRHTHRQCAQRETGGRQPHWHT